MLNKKIIMGMAALFAASALFAANPPPGSTMTLILEDGSEVVLQPDSTWNYSKPTILQADSNDDIFTTLRDNRIVWLKPDYTWTFTKTQPKANRDRNYANTEAFGTALKPDLNAAEMTAKSQLYDKLAASLTRYIANPKAKNAQAYLLACIKDDVKENELDTKYEQTKQGWKYDAKMVLPSYRVKKIIDCWDLQMTP